MIIYHAPAEAMAQMANATEEQKMEGMKPWMAWKDSVGNAMVDMGAPLFGGIKLNPDGTSESSAKEVSGYSILQGRSLEEVKGHLKNHPHLAWNDGCDIEVHECAEM